MHSADFRHRVGAAASLVTTPFRRQVDVGGGVGGAWWPSTMSVLGKIAAEEEWAGMFNGVTPRVLRTAPVCAIMIGSYELGKICRGGIVAEES